MSCVTTAISITDTEVIVEMGGDKGFSKDMTLIEGSKISIVKTDSGKTYLLGTSGAYAHIIGIREWLKQDMGRSKIPSFMMAEFSTQTLLVEVGTRSPIIQSIYQGGYIVDWDGKINAVGSATDAAYALLNTGMSVPEVHMQLHSTQIYMNKSFEVIECRHDLKTGDMRFKHDLYTPTTTWELSHKNTMPVCKGVGAP